MILGEQCSKIFRKCESDIDIDEHNTLLTYISESFCTLSYSLHIVLNTKCIKDISPLN